MKHVRRTHRCVRHRLSVPSSSGKCLKQTPYTHPLSSTVILSVPSSSGKCLKLKGGQQQLLKDSSFSPLFIGEVFEARIPFVCGLGFNSFSPLFIGEVFEAGEGIVLTPDIPNLSVPSSSGKCLKREQGMTALLMSILSVPSSSGKCLKPDADSNLHSGNFLLSVPSSSGKCLKPALTCSPFMN